MTLKDYYDDVGDVLAPYRKLFSGAIMPTKDNPEPFSSDPDVIQFNRDEKLREQISTGSFTKKESDENERPINGIFEEKRQNPAPKRQGILGPLPSLSKTIDKN